MKIGIEAQRIYRSHKHGMDFVALEMIRQLQKLDKVNQYYIFINEGPDICLQPSENFKMVVFGGSYPLWEQVYLPRRASQYQLDLLHCTSNTAPVNCPVPLLVTIHDIIYLENHPLRQKGYSIYQKFGNLYRKLIVSKLLKSKVGIITVSEYEKQRFVQFLGMEEGEVEVVYNGVGSHFKPISDSTYLNEIRVKYQLPDKFLLFLGNTDPKKNTRNTVVAFARYCKKYGKTHKLIIGDLDPQIIRAFLKDAGLEEFFGQIGFSGYIPNNELPALINLAEIFLYPSRRESFGIPILESMASGTPVITGNTSSMPEVGGDAALYVDPDDVESISESIKKLLSNEELRNDYREKGLKRALDFSWENSALRVLEIYNNYLNLR